MYVLSHVQVNIEENKKEKESDKIIWINIFSSASSFRQY